MSDYPIQMAKNLDETYVVEYEGKKYHAKTQEEAFQIIINMEGEKLMGEGLTDDLPELAD